MQLLHVTSYGVDKEYDFTPHIPTFYNAYQIAAQKMFALLPKPKDVVENNSCDIHRTNVPSQISDNRFGYTVHESSFHKCWTIGQKEPSIWEDESIGSELSECNGSYLVVKKSTEFAAAQLCHSMNQTVLHSVLMVLYQKGLLPHRCETHPLSTLLSIFNILFADGENEFIEGIHGIHINDHHPCIVRRYHPNPARLLLAVQVKDMGASGVKALKDILSNYEQIQPPKLNGIEVIFYDSTFDYKDTLFDEAFGTILWSFGYGQATNPGVYGTGQRPFVLRKIKTASAKEYRVIFDVEEGLQFNVPTNVALVIPSGKSLEVYLDCLCNDHIFYGLCVKKGTSDEVRYCIFNENALSNMEKTTGIRITAIEEGRYYMELQNMTDDLTIRAERRSVTTTHTEMETYFGISMKEGVCGVPETSAENITQPIGDKVSIQFAFQFCNEVRKLDNTRNAFAAFALPYQQYTITDTMESATYRIPDSDIKIYLEHVGFGDHPLMLLQADVPKKVIQCETFVLRIQFFTGAFIASKSCNNTNGDITKINTPFVLQFVLRTCDDALTVESLYAWSPLSPIPWSPIVPKEILMQNLLLSVGDLSRDLRLERFGYSRYKLFALEGASVRSGIVDRPETEFPYTVKATNAVRGDESLYFAVFYVPVSKIANKSTAVVYGTRESAGVKDLVLSKVTVTTSSLSLPLDLGAENYVVEDKPVRIGCTCNENNLGKNTSVRVVTYYNIPVRVVSERMSFPILFGREDEIQVSIPDIGFNFYIHVQLPEPTSTETPDSGKNTGGDAEVTEPENPPHIGEGEDEF